jgi:adenine-specific DNA-methyltransferase
MTKPILTTPTPNQLKLEILREHFPQAIEVDAEGHIRINAAGLQQAIDPSNAAGIQVEEDGYELRWVGKREAYHSAFVPAQKIVAPLPDDSKNWDSTGNILMRGDNLDALRLLRHSYFGAVKLIYIDPPYNTQSDAFIYRDDFSAKQSEVLAQLGYSADNIEYIKNIYGARTHSGWLSFMYPRLLLAKDLLRDDGVIFISIDDNEQAQLKLLCDEVFGQENFVAQFIWQHRKSSQNDVDLSLSHNYKLAYAKQRSDFKLNALDADPSKFTNPDNDPLGPWVADPMDAPNVRENLTYAITNPESGQEYWPPRGRCWRFSKDKYQEAINQGRIVFGKSGTSKPQYKRYLTEAKAKGVNPFTIWSEWGTATEGTKELMKHFDGRKIFETPKPTRLLKEIIGLATQQEDLILDFFAGSGTTGEAVMRLNAEDGGCRRFILVQIPQVIDSKNQKEAHSFVIETLGKPKATIFEITAERLRRAGVKIEAEKPGSDTGFRVFDLVNDPDALIISKPLYDATQDDVRQLQVAIATPQPAQLPRVLYNLLLAEGLPLTTALRTIKDQHLYLAQSDNGHVALIVQAIALTELTDTLRQLQTDGTPAVYLTVYAPWIADDNFMLGIKTMAESLGYSEDKLRLRG